MEEEETTPKQEHTPITLNLSHDQAVAVGVATIYQRVLLSGLAESAQAIAHLDSIYQMIMQHSQISPVSKETLRDMRLLVTGLKDEQPEGGSQHATARPTA
jgi:hypothetical protein